MNLILLPATECGPVVLGPVRAECKPSMNVAAPIESTPLQPEVCVITVLYDGDGARRQAMAACDFLVGQFWRHIELEFHWWRTDFLRDPQMALAAAENAVATDFLIVCTEDPLGTEAESWFESWLARRAGPAGALVDLPPKSRRSKGGTSNESFLREVCRRASFDYLSNLPGEGEEPSEVGAGDDTGYVTSPEDQSERFRPPSHYGLNE